MKIKGQAIAGSELKADLSEVKGAGEDQLSFSWAVKDDSGSREVSTGKSYTPSDADVGKAVVLTITGKADQGIEGSLTATTGKVEPKPQPTEEPQPEPAAEEPVYEEPVPEVVYEEVPAEEPVYEEEPQEAEYVEIPVEELPEITTEEEVFEIPSDDSFEESAPEEPVTEDQDTVEVPDEGDEWTADPSLGDVQEEVFVINEETGEAEPAGTEIVAEAEPVAEAVAAVSDGSEILDFGTLDEEQLADPEVRYVTVTNSGNVPLDFEGISPEHFMVEDIKETLEPGAAVNLWIQPREGLEDGTYEDTITYVSEQGAEASFTARAVIVTTSLEEEDEEQIPETEGEIVIDPEALVGDSDQEVPDTEPDGMDLAAASAGQEEAPDLTKDETAETDGETEPAETKDTDNKTEPEKTTDTEGETESEETPDAEGEGGTDPDETKDPAEEKDPEEEEPAAPVVSASLDQDVVAFDMVEGEEAPSAIEVVLTNDGTAPVTVASQNAELFVIEGLGSAAVEAGGTVTFTVRPTEGLPKGEYAETLRIVNAETDEVLAELEADLSVKEPAPVYTIKAAPAELSFIDSTAPQSVTVTNTGNSTVNLVQPASTDFFTIGTLSAAVLAPQETADFTITPKDGLTGTIAETITITSAEKAEDTVDLFFEKNEKKTNLVSIKNPDDITGVKNGSEKSADGLGLPGKVTVVTTDGEKSASVSWDVKSAEYDPSSAEEQIFTVRGKVTLPEGIENPDNLDLVAAVKVTVSARKAKIADSDNNQIKGISSKKDVYTTETKISFTAVGAGMDNKDPQKGDTRFIPTKWNVMEERKWSSAPYEATFRVSKAGTYTLAVTFAEQEYDGSSWVKTGNTDVKKVTFTVNKTSTKPTATPAPTGKGKNADRRNPGLSQQKKITQALIRIITGLDMAGTGDL